MKLSIVIPVFNEEKLIDELMLRLNALYDQLVKVFSLQKTEIETLFINDGSWDQSLHKLKSYAQSEKGLKIVSLSRNFGHQVALTAGIDLAQGDAIVAMDADLQDPPEIIVDMYKKFLEGYDVIYGVRKRRDGESWFKLFTAKLFYLLLKKIAHVEIPINTGDFRMISKRVKLALSSMKEKHRLIRGMISWVGFRQTAVEYNREARFGGETKYPLHKMLKLSLDGITSFSTVPLKIVSFSGVLISGCGLLYALYVIIQKLTGQPYVQGWSSIIVIILVIGGIQLIAFGILGEYIGRIFEESKNRPLYLIDEVYENDE